MLRDRALDMLELLGPFLAARRKILELGELDLGHGVLFIRHPGMGLAALVGDVRVQDGLFGIGMAGEHGSEPLHRLVRGRGVGFAEAAFDFPVLIHDGLDPRFAGCKRIDVAPGLVAGFVGSGRSDGGGDAIEK